MSRAKKQLVSSPHDSNRDSSCFSQFICRAMDDKCVCVSVSLLKYRYILPMMVCLTRSQSGNDASICSIFSALGSWSPCLSPGYKGYIWEEIAGDLTSSFHWHYAFRHSKPFVFLSCMKLQAGEITFIQIIFVTQGYPISPYLFKPLFSSFLHRRLQWAGKGNVCVSSLTFSPSKPSVSFGKHCRVLSLFINCLSGALTFSWSPVHEV